MPTGAPRTTGHKKYRSKRSYKKKASPYSWMNTVNPMVKKVTGLMRSVAHLKSIVNSELKETVNQAGSTPIRLGQFDGATTLGYNTQELTPQPGQGNTSSTRNGDSIKLDHMNIKFRWYTMSIDTPNMEIRVVILHTKDEDETVANIASQVFLVDNWTSTPIRTSNSEFNHDYKDTYTLLKDIRFHFPGDEGVLDHPAVIEKQLTLRFKNHHVRYDNNTTTPVSGRIVLITFASAGNANAITATTDTGAPVTLVNSGVFMAYKATSYFYDN